MTTYEVNTTYEPFSNEPEYIEANRAFVAGMDFSNCRRLLDLACGTGLMTELALAARPDLEVVGLDLSLESLKLAEERFARNNGAHVLLLHGSADCVPLPDCSVQAVIMGNAIHMLRDRERLLSEIRRILAPGGFFAFNSSFYAGTFAQNTERFYHDWIKMALLYVADRDRQLRAEGRPGIRRKRGTAGGAFSNTWLSKAEWAEALARNGLKVTGTNERTVIMTQRSFETIGAYAGFAEVLLSGYPVYEASVALQATAGPAMEAFGAPTLPRYWLEMIATRQP